MTTNEARKLIADEAKNMSDEQLREMMNALDAIAEMVIDLYLSLPPEERKKYRKQSMRGQLFPSA